MSSKNPKSGDKIAQTRQQLDEVTAVMQSNVESVIARGESLEELEERSADLEKGGKLFERDATKMKKKFCCEAYKWWLIRLLVVAVVILFIALLIYAATTK